MVNVDFSDGETISQANIVFPAHGSLSKATAGSSADLKRVGKSILLVLTLTGSARDSPRKITKVVDYSTPGGSVAVTYLVDSSSVAPVVAVSTPSGSTVVSIPTIPVLPVLGNTIIPVHWL